MNDYMIPLDLKPCFVQQVRVIVLTSDKDLQIIFLLTYCQYASQEELFLAAEDLYLSTGYEKNYHAKLVEFLYLWISKEDHMDRKLRRKVLELAQLYVPESDSSPIAKVAKRFRLPTFSASYFMFKESASAPPSPRDLESTMPSPIPSPRPVELRHSISLCRFPENTRLDILKYRSRLLAEQLTLIDHELVGNVSTFELKNKILRPSDNKFETVAHVSSRFNTVSFWVATQIVIAPTSKLRVEIIEKYISIAAVRIPFFRFKFLMYIIFIEITQTK
jgi:hypothetical protein